MTDLFADKAADWDTRPLPQRISAGVSAALLARVPLEPDQTVLDFGAGTGLLTGAIAPKVGSVFAVDTSPAMLAQLTAKLASSGKVEPVCQDLLAAPLGRRVDLIISAMAMHHVQDTAALLRTFFEHLVPGGRVALADLDREPGDFHPPEVEGVFHHGFDRDAFTALLRQAGFTDVHFDTACSVDKDERSYAIFLVTAVRPQ
ncbi:MAG: methyltransferase domain-containing protein [Myxococcales bacterium]|nr:methyltransferase domain-containing protein [Myxococcales bacterium]